MDDSERLAEFRVKDCDLPDLAFPCKYQISLCAISDQWQMEWRDSCEMLVRCDVFRGLLNIVFKLDVAS